MAYFCFTSVCYSLGKLLFRSGIFFNLSLIMNVIKLWSRIWGASIRFRIIQGFFFFDISDKIVIPNKNWPMKSLNATCWKLVKVAFHIRIKVSEDSNEKKPHGYQKPRYKFSLYKFTITNPLNLYSTEIADSVLDSNRNCTFTMLNYKQYFVLWLFIQ